MELELFYRINSFVGVSAAFDEFVTLLLRPHFRTVPFMLILWSLWFLESPEFAKRRERLIAILISALVIVLATRIMAEILPFRLRPMHDPDVLANLPNWSDPAELEGWSSMPSDHASLFFGLAMGFFLMNRVAGVIAFILAVFVVSLPRIYFALHWPTDILVGALVGITMALVVLKPLTYLVDRSGIVPYFEARPAIGYPLLFFVTLELALMFNLAQYIYRAVLL